MLFVDIQIITKGAVLNPRSPREQQQSGFVCVWRKYFLVHVPEFLKNYWMLSRENLPRWWHEVASSKPHLFSSFITPYPLNFHHTPLSQRMSDAFPSDILLPDSWAWLGHNHCETEMWVLGSVLEPAVCPGSAKDGRAHLHGATSTLHPHRDWELFSEFISPVNP